MTPQERVQRIRKRYARRAAAIRAAAELPAVNDALVEEIEAAVKDKGAGLTYAAVARALGTDRRNLHALKMGWLARREQAKKAD